jgi:hypothetical protein
MISTIQLTMRRSFLSVLIVLAAATLAALGSTDFHIIDQNGQVTTDIPGATVVLDSPGWDILLPPNFTGAGNASVPFPFPIGSFANANGLGAEITEITQVSPGSVNPLLTVTDASGIVHNVILEALAPTTTNGAPDASSSLALLSVSLLGLGALSRRVHAA